MKDNELIVCRDVSLGYEGKSVLTDLDLTIAKGDYLCVVGDNGSGKSTLMRGLLGLIQPQSGTIEHALALKHGAIGYLPQQTRAQRDFPATVLEVVLSGCLNRQGLHFFYTPAQRSEAMMNLGKLGILELKDACYRDLSGGQQQRVLLARALCAASQLLILDEPITGLDPAAAQDLYKTLAIGILVISRTTGMTTDVDNYMFGSVLAMTKGDVALSVILSVTVLTLYLLFYHQIFAVTFDESFSRATGLKVDACNTLLAILTALTIVLGMRMMGAMLISSLVIFPALTAMRLFKSFRGVILCAAVTSVVCFCVGLTISFGFSTPVGATVVAADLTVFLAACLLAALRRK